MTEISAASSHETISLMQAKSSSAKTKPLANDYAPCILGALRLIACSLAQPDLLQDRASAEDT